MVVRDAADRDLAAIIEILDREVREGFAHFGSEPMDAERVRADFEAESATYPWIVADEEGDVLGFARAYPWKARAGYAWTVEVGVYVRVDAQGRGIGRALYERLIPDLKRAGFHVALGGIALPNDPSVRLHESLGFRRVGTLPEVGWKLGAWRDVGYWALLLSDGPPLEPNRIWSN